MALGELIRAMQLTGMETNFSDLRDILWLASKIQSPLPEIAQDNQSQTPQKNEQTGPSPSQSRRRTAPLESTHHDLELEHKQTPFALYGAAAPGTGDFASRIRVRGAPAVADSLAIGRALRPLSRRRSGASNVLDERATAEFIADTSVIAAVWRPARERWFDIAMAVEDVPTLAVWAPVVAELFKLFIRQGGFRSVSVLTLKEENQTIVAYGPNGRKVPVRELGDRLGRRIVLVVSDCTSSAWRTGMCGKWLQEISKIAQVAVTQLLPQILWPNTAIGFADLRSSAKHMGAPSSQLLVQRPAWAMNEPGVVLPVFELTARSVGTWSRMATASGDAWGTAALLPLPDGNYKVADPAFTLSAEQRAATFRASATLDAQRLAAYFSVVQPLTPPLMRTIQRVMVQKDGVSALAQVFLGGILFRVEDPLGKFRSIDETEYDFYPIVRDLLRVGLTRQDFVQVQLALHDFLQRQSGIEFDFFALLQDSDGSARLPANALPFVSFSRAAAAHFLPGIGGVKSGQKSNAGPSLKRPKKGERRDYIRPVKYRWPAGLDFSLYIAEKRKGFEGQESSFHAVHDWITNDSGRVLAFVSPAGAGKSAFAAELVQRNPENRIVGHHFCQISRSETLSPAAFVWSIARQFAERFDSYAEVLDNNHFLQVALNDADVDAIYAFGNAVLTPLGELITTSPDTKYIVVDAIDESGFQSIEDELESDRTIEELLRECLNLFPPWLRLLVTTRPRATPVLGGTQELRVVKIDGGTPEELRHYLHARIARGPKFTSIESTPFAEILVSRIVEAVDGSFLYAKIALDAFMNGIFTEQDFPSIPKSLYEFYRIAFERLFEGHDFLLTGRILALLIAHGEPLRDGELAQLLTCSGAQVQKSIGHIADFVRDGDDGYALYDRSLADWLLELKDIDPYSTSRFSVDIEGAKHLLEAWDKTIERSQEIANNIARVRDKVEVFSPDHKSIWLPMGSTCLDFAYAIHSDIGNQCVAVKVNNELVPLRTELRRGEVVEIITAPYSKPNPAWLGFVRTGKARMAIRHYLKKMRPAESRMLGERLVDQALKEHGLALSDVTPQAWAKLLHWTGAKNRDEIFIDIGLGRRISLVMAKRIKVLMSVPDANEVDKRTGLNDAPSAVPIVITGTEGMSVQLSTCCRPIPGDAVMGYVGIGLGMAVHTTDCRVAERIHWRDPTRWIDIAWAPQPGRLFNVAIKIIAKDTGGTFGSISADLASSDAVLVSIKMVDNGLEKTTTLRLLIQVCDRNHLAKVIRRVRANPKVMRVTRERLTDSTQA